MSANSERDWRILSKRLWAAMAFWVGMDLYELLELVVLLDDEQREQAIAGLLLNAYRR
jgi:hypothetical protein